MTDWKIVTGDCVREMAAIAPGSVRLIVADPPYNIGVNYGDHHDDRMTPAEYVAWSGRWIQAAVRLLAPDGSLWLINDHRWSARLQIAMEAAGLHRRQTITWYETFGVNCTHQFNRCSRPLLCLARVCEISSTRSLVSKPGTATLFPSTQRSATTSPNKWSRSSGVSTSASCAYPECAWSLPLSTLP